MTESVVSTRGNYTTLGGSEAPDGTPAGKVMIAGYAGGENYNRELSSAQITTLTTLAVAKFTWASGSRPSSIDIKPIGGAVWVCFDAVDDAGGLDWCQGENGEATDSQRFLVSEFFPEGSTNSTNSSSTFSFTSGVSNMYILEYSTAVTALTVEASK